MTIRQDESTALRFGSVDFATEESSTSEASDVRDAAAKYGEGKIASVFIEMATSRTDPIIRYAF